jgi:O-antigen ligase
VLGVAAVVLVAMVGSGSRSCYAAAGIGVVVVALVYRPLPVGRRILLAVGVVTAIVAFVIVGAASGLWATGLWTRIVELSQRGLAEGGRDQIWGGGLQMGAEHPLLGVGIGNFPVELLIRKGFFRMGHNDFITHFAETGIPGILLYLAMLAAVLRSAWKTSEPALRAGLIGLFVAVVIASMANPSYGEKSFWLHLALCVLGGAVSVVAPAPGPALGADGRLAGSGG